MAKVICYTDGSAITDFPRLGGFGIYIKNGINSFKIRKGFCNTKTGRMELTAVLYCLRSIKNKNLFVIIYSDSQYTVKSCNNWVEGWEKRGWVGVKNCDLMKQLLYELRQFSRRPKLIHIKGHQQITDLHTEGNNIADQLASYKTQKSYELDLPIDDYDLTTFEKNDFCEKDGKTYYRQPEF